MKIMSAIVRSASIVAGMSNGYEFITLPRPPVHGARPTLRIPCGRGLTPPAVMDSTPPVLAVRIWTWIILILLPDILYSAHSGEVSLVLHGPPPPPAPPAYSFHRRSPFMLCKPELPCYMEHPYSCVCVYVYMCVCVYECVSVCLCVRVWHLVRVPEDYRSINSALEPL